VSWRCSSFADENIEEVEEDITVESDGVPIHHVCGGYSPSPFSPNLEFNTEDGSILPPPTEMVLSKGLPPRMAEVSIPRFGSVWGCVVLLPVWLLACELGFLLVESDLKCCLRVS
jgi:hypothetical protein